MAPPVPAAAAPSPIVDASKPRPIAPLPAPPTLQTGAGAIPSPTSEPRENIIESHLPSATASQNAIPTPPQTPGMLGAVQDEQTRLRESGSGIHQIQNPLLKGLAATADTAGQILAPRLEQAIPGTEGHHQMLLGQNRGRIKELETSEDEAAKRGLTAAQTEHMQAQTENLENPNPLNDELTQARIDRLNNPATAAGRQPKVIKDADGYLYRDSGDGEPTPLIVNGEHMKGPMPAAAADKPLADKAAYQALRAKENRGEALTPEEQANKKAFEQTIQTTMTDPGVARMTALAQSRIVPILQGNEGDVGYDTAGHAMNAGAKSPQSIGFQTNKAVTKSATSGNIGAQITAYNTAIDHLQSLEEAGKALHNTDVPLFNKVAQAYAKQTGSAAPANFDAVKSALKGEIGSAFRKGVTTEGESKELDSSIDKIQSPAQLAGVAAQFRQLLASKRGNLQGQVEQGQQGKANFEGSKGGGTALPDITMDDIRKERERRKGAK